MHDSIAVTDIVFFVVSAAAPLTAVAGGVPLSMMLGNGPGIPLTFLLVTGILLLFAVGYRVANADTLPEWKPGNEFKAKREEMLGK